MGLYVLMFLGYWLGAFAVAFVLSKPLTYPFWRINIIV